MRTGHRDPRTSVRNRCAVESVRGAAPCRRSPLPAYSCRQWNKLTFYFLLDHRYGRLFSLEVSQEFLKQMHHFAHQSDMLVSVLCPFFPLTFPHLLSISSTPKSSGISSVQGGGSDGPLVTSSVSCFPANLPPIGRAHLASPFLSHSTSHWSAIWGNAAVGLYALLPEHALPHGTLPGQPRPAPSVLPCHCCRSVYGQPRGSPYLSSWVTQGHRCKGMLYADSTLCTH